ncbi:serine/threonine-protein kinase [Smaragdicoccus niigatensis]|uniref:serine/threonine-protein kinase n=1 Tax=Smaragdicoccus niigatensis TaxID=359359 RepID=UPI00036E1012|nr:serine/threonine-protein kinase [Smaragdicoccus niigatensis]
MPEERGFMQPGSTVSGYTIIRLLGSGGMGQVYLAQHPRLPRYDAIKVLYPHLGGDESFRARFQREANLAAQLSHPNIVPVYDAGEDNGILWLAMQYIDGTDASRLIAESPRGIDPSLAIDIVTQAGRGLDRAHSRGMLHRDVKPANLLLTGDWDHNDPAAHHVLVSDFGIARTLANTTNLTNTGSILATISYAAPEILQAGTIDHRADIYALGCTLYELLTGSKPFPRPDMAAVMLAHITEAPPRPTFLRPELPAAIDDVIATAMAKSPDARYQSCKDLAIAARAALTGTAMPPPPPPPPVMDSAETVLSSAPPSRSDSGETVASPRTPAQGVTPPPPPPIAAMANVRPQGSPRPPANGGKSSGQGGGGKKAALAVAAVALLAAAGAGTWYTLNNSDKSSGGSGESSMTMDMTSDSEATTSELPADEQCTDDIKSNPLWVCLTSAKIVDGQLVIQYTAEWAGTTPNINGGYHLHIWGSDGTTPDPDTMGTQAAYPGKWVIKDTDPAVLTADEVAQVIGSNTKVCARIGNSQHQLKADHSGGYNTGNCVTIEH